MSDEVLEKNLITAFRTEPRISEEACLRDNFIERKIKVINGPRKTKPTEVLLHVVCTKPVPQASRKL